MAEKQTHKDTIVIWHEASQLFDRGERARALDSLRTIQEPTARILYNIGHTEVLLGRTHDAVQTFRNAIEKDQHMGITHFQLAETYYKKQNYKTALQSLQKAHGCFRGNKFIDYKQLGLQYKLYECEILHNLAVVYAALDDRISALDLMNEAVKCKVESRQTAIKSSLDILKQGKLPKPFAVPEDHIFRPPAAKVQNIQGIDYLGKAKVVSELVVPDSENKRGRSPSPNTPQGSPPAPPPSQSTLVSSHNFKPITSLSRSPSPNPRGPPPSRPPPAAPRSSPAPPSYPPPVPSPTPPSNRASPSPSPTPLGSKLKHRDTITLWNEGVLMFEHGQVRQALDHMMRIRDPSAKILFNIGMLHLKLGNLQEASEIFQLVVEKDAHLAIGHYQCGNIQCQLTKPDQARRSFDKCLSCFRGHKFIDYKQLGLAYKLYEFEVLHNQAWVYFKLGQKDKSRQLLRDAQGTKAETKHDAIDSSLKNAEAGVSFDIMLLPKGALFRPPKAKIDNLNKIDFLGQAKVVSELSPGSERNTSPSPNRVSPIEADAFYLPMSSPQKSLPSRPDLTSPPLHFPNSQNQVLAVPPRSSSLSKSSDKKQMVPPLSPAFPSRTVPPIPIRVSSADSTIPRRSPPLPPQPQIHQNGLSGASNKLAPAFDPNKPLPVLPNMIDLDDQLVHASEDDLELVYTNTTPTSQQSPVQTSKPLPAVPSDSPRDQRRKPASPLPPRSPLPPPPPGKYDASKMHIQNRNGQFPKPAGLNNNTQKNSKAFKVAIESYVGKDETELSFSSGEIIKHCREVSPGILEGECGGQRGRFPKSAIRDPARISSS